MTQIALNNFSVEVQQYQIQKQAKLYQYNMINTFSDSLYPMGSHLRLHTLTIVTPSGIAWGQTANSYVAEAIIQILRIQVITLTDVEGVVHQVQVQDWKVEHNGGEEGIYTITVDLRETNA